MVQDATILSILFEDIITKNKNKKKKPKKTNKQTEQQQQNELGLNKTAVLDRLS